MTLSPVLVGVVVAVLVVAGAVNAVAGFGFAVVGTMVLATVIEPATAVVFMILPIFSVNVSLVRELSPAEVRTCGRRFGPLVLAALVGTLAGMALLDRMPAALLRIGLGVVTLAFVASLQEYVALPGMTRVRQGCFVQTPFAMAGVGGVFGLLFGGTNVGVQFVAYLRSCDLRHGLFVGVVALVFLGLNAVRVAVAGVLGLYPDPSLAAASLAATVPALTGVAVGKYLRDVVDERRIRTLVVALLTVVGVQLVLTGAGIV